MANNIIQQGPASYQFPAALTNPATPASGDPGRLATLTGIALTAEAEGGNLAGQSSNDFGPFIADLSVKGIDASGNSAVAAGDLLYYVDADTPKLSKKTTGGYVYGYALEAVGSGETATINVLHSPPPGAGTTPADGSVTAAKLGANAVGTAALSATLGIGFIPLDIFGARVIGTNEIAAQVGAATDPLLKRSNTSTDKSATIAWESASVIEIQLPPVCYPPDLDDTADVYVHVLAKMKAGSVNTPVLTLSAWEGAGDANMGGNTGALSTTMQDLSITLPTAHISAHPNVLNVSVLPGAHATASNDVLLYGAWIEYTRK